MAREAVIVGAGDVPPPPPPLEGGRVVGGGSVLQVQARAAKAALDDAGIAMRDVDGAAGGRALGRAWARAATLGDAG